MSNRKEQAVPKSCHPLPIQNNNGDAILTWRSISDLDVLRKDGTIARNVTYRAFRAGDISRKKKGK